MRPWRPRETTKLFEHPLVDLEHRRVAASADEERDVLVFRMPEWVNVIAYEEGGRIVMVRQWRHGIVAATLEIPGGVVEPGEELATAAARELLEETGYRAPSLRPLGAVTPNPALQSNRCTTFLAERVVWECPPVGDGEEELEVELVDPDEVPDLIRRGEIDHALVLAALHLEALDAP